MLQLDLVIGETNQIESDDKSKLEDIATRVKDLNARLKDVRREQVFQRVSDPPHVCVSKPKEHGRVTTHTDEFGGLVGTRG